MRLREKTRKADVYFHRLNCGAEGDPVTYARGSGIRYGAAHPASVTPYCDSEVHVDKNQVSLKHPRFVQTERENLYHSNLQMYLCVTLLAKEMHTNYV